MKPYVAARVTHVGIKSGNIEYLLFHVGTIALRIIWHIKPAAPKTQNNDVISLITGDPVMQHSHPILTV